MVSNVGSDSSRNTPVHNKLLAIASSCRPSDCLLRCALWLSVSVYRAKSCTSVFLAVKFLFVPSDTFCCRMYRLAAKCTERTSRKCANVSFFEKGDQACTVAVFLQRVSIACYAERCISYDRFCLTDRLTV